MSRVRYIRRRPLTPEIPELRPYQIECVKRAIDRESLLVAMVMGSGKTAAIATTIKELRERDEVFSGAVFALNSVKFQWLSELAKFDPDALVQVVDGDRKQRWAMIRRSCNYNYTILHYETLVNDWEQIKQYLNTDFLVADEITFIKGFTAKRSRRLKSMRNSTVYRYGLSGQPIENRPEELFSAMEFVDPSVLGDFDKFDRTFIKRDYWGRPKKYVNLDLLRKIMSDAMFRKSRADIAEWLPVMIEMEIPVLLDNSTMGLHAIVKHDLLDALDRAIDAGVTGGFDLASHYGRSPRMAAGARGEVMSRLLAMRMLACHPALLRYSADNFDDPDSRHGSQYASDLRASGVLDNLPRRHIKLDHYLELVDEILAEDPAHKVVTFCYFKPMLAMIGSELTRLKIPYTTITGDIKAKDREVRRVRFNTDPRCRVFLSSDAGAYGIDLNAGSHLINYDLPWSAGVLQQRISRIDRTSSGFPSIHTMFMYGKNTIEQRMFNLLHQKIAVAEAFLDGKFDSRSGVLPLDYQSLREFLLST